VRQGTECIRLLLGDLQPVLRDSIIEHVQGKNTNDEEVDDDDGDDDNNNNNNNNNKDTNACTRYHICRTLTLLPDILWSFKMKSLSPVDLVYILNVR